MRKSILCTALAAAGVIAGCSGNGSGYKIIATSQDAFAQGDTILLIDYDTDERIDSARVRGKCRQGKDSDVDQSRQASCRISA